MIHSLIHLFIEEATIVESFLVYNFYFMSAIVGVVSS